MHKLSCDGIIFLPVELKFSLWLKLRAHPAGLILRFPMLMAIMNVLSARVILSMKGWIPNYLLPRFGRFGHWWFSSLYSSRARLS